MKLPIIKNILFILAIFVALSFFPAPALAYPPNVFGRVKTNLGAPLGGIALIMNNNQNAERSTSTDSQGNYSFEAEDGWGCNESPLSVYVQWGQGVNCTGASTGGFLENISRNMTLDDIICYPPPPPPTATPTPTKIPCGGPCTGNNQCDLACPICAPDNTCMIASPTPLPTATPTPLPTATPTATPTLTPSYTPTPSPNPTVWWVYNGVNGQAVGTVPPYRSPTPNPFKAQAVPTSAPTSIIPRGNENIELPYMMVNPPFFGIKLGQMVTPIPTPPR